MKNDLKLQLICGLILFLSACSPIINTQYSKYLSLKSETSECLTNYTYTNSIIVTGQAKFFKRGINLVVQTGELKNMTLGDPLADALPIRYAEIAVYNSSNHLVQCGITNASGNLKAIDGSADLLIPAVKDSYTIRVLARMNAALADPADSSKVKLIAHAAIKQDIYTNEVHYIAKTIASSGVDNLNNVDLFAYARQTDSVGVEGGAFNILNSIYTAYDYIRNNTNAIDTTCMNEKLNIYWKLGFNPFQYTDPTGNPSSISNGSFYNKVENNLFITGGRLGDISIDVTNHFDDFVIIHEFGHHVENKCGQLLTPGGSHFILARIDPRLAWAEGWANYFAGQVLFNSITRVNPELETKLTLAGLSSNWTYLFASKGFSDSLQNIGNGTGFMFDMKKAGNNPDTWQYGDFMGNSFDKVDPNRYPGEGHFREGAITRGLFKLTNACGGTCTTATPITFDKVWKSIDKITGAGQASFPFKGSHDVLEILKTFVTAPTWTTQFLSFNQNQTSEALHLFSDGAYLGTGSNTGKTYWVPYGFNLKNISNTNTCSTQEMHIQPRTDDPVLTSTNSDQRYSNHFYTIDLNTLVGLDEITITLSNPVGTTTEFDLLLFQEDYFYNGDYVCSASDSAGNCTSYVPSRTSSSDVLRSDRRSGALTSKTIRNLQALDHSKRYLLNVRAYTPNKTLSSTTDYTYILTTQLSGTKYLCP